MKSNSPRRNSDDQFSSDDSLKRPAVNAGKFKRNRKPSIYDEDDGDDDYDYRRDLIDEDDRKFYYDDVEDDDDFDEDQFDDEDFDDEDFDDDNFDEDFDEDFDDEDFDDDDLYWKLNESCLNFEQLFYATNMSLRPWL